MAETLVYRIHFITNITGQWNQNDVVTIYYDDTEPLSNPNPYLVYLNGSPLASSPFLIPLSNSGTTLIFSYNPQICRSNALAYISRIQFFPYATAAYLTDHPSCVFGGPNCDLSVIGQPVLLRPNDAVSATGSITINATSSNTIEYKIGSDFSYGDGTAQSSNTFTGLIAGTYRIYLRDSDNCGNNISVILPVNNDYAVRYRGEYDDIIGGVTRIDILERSYVGEISEICEDGTPLQINMRGDGTTDKFEPVLAVESVFNLLSRTDQQFIGLYTNDREKYRIKIYKNGQLKLYQKVLPQQYRDQYCAPPYTVTFSATCGLPTLKEYTLVQDDGQILFGTISLIKLVALCLSRIQTGLPIRVACNLYAVDMDQTDSDDPFDQAFIDYEAFYLSGETPTLDFVLRSILEAFGARIVQWDGRWNIVRIEEMISEYDYRDFDSDGEYIDNGTFDPVVNLNYPSNQTGAVIFCNKDQSFEVQPGYGLFKVIYKLGLKPNILKNGDFRLIAVFDQESNEYFFKVNTNGFLLINGGYPIAELYERIDLTNVAYLLQGGGANTPETGAAYLKSDTYLMKMGTNNQLKITIRYKLPLLAVVAGSTVFYAEPPYIKVRIVVRMGLGYLSNDGNWTLTPTEVTFYTKEYGKYVESEIIAQSPTGILSGADTGLNFNVSVYHAYVFHADFTDVTIFKAFDTLLLGEATKKTFRTDDYFTSEVYPDKLLYYELEENTSSEDIPNIIRPDDYLDNPSLPNQHNPKQWILKNKISVTPYANHDVQFWIDKIQVKFLTDGNDPIDSILRSKNGESYNTEVSENELTIGSESSLIVSETYLDDRFSWAVPGAQPIKVTTTTNILSADILYAGYLRDANGVGYDDFARDAITESAKLHSIYLVSRAAQYNRPWVLMRGSIYSKNTYLGLLNTINEVNANNRKFLLMSLTIDDKKNQYKGEYLELIDIFEDAGSDGGSGTPYSSGFTTGFGQSGFD